MIVPPPQLRGRRGLGERPFDHGARLGAPKAHPSAPPTPSYRNPDWTVPSGSLLRRVPVNGAIEQIGPYRLLEVLGEGGMGVVYRAEQREPVRREVALKLIRAGIASDIVVRRFETERQALAVMEHPSIARVYDGGVTADGHPYFVMELVRGVPLLEYCDAHQLGLADRIQLFTQICRAVQHAHQKGVIHRDLKPSNILVADTDGVPLAKVIDFGIARAVEAGADVARLTMADEMIGTPAYMSPEQMDPGMDIDTRSDVYSLGVVLYELFTGSLPFDDTAYRGIAAFAAVQVREPPTPGQRISRLGASAAEMAARRSSDPAGLVRALRGDLDWIVMKALEKERDRRYESANALALDLERALANEPVLARAPTTTYRMRKFVRRHAVGVASSAVIIALMIGGIVLQAVQAGRVAEARDEAVVRRTQAEGLIDFMLGDLWEKLEPVGRLEILDDVGERAVAYFAEVEPSQFSDDEISNRSKMLYNIGSVRMRQGNLAAAIRAFEESLRLARELSARAPDDAERQFALGQSEFWVGSGFLRQARYDEAASHFGAYRDISVALVARDSTNNTWLQELGYSHTNLGVVEQSRGNAAAAAVEYRRAMEVKERVLAGAPDDHRLRYDLARAHYNLGAALITSGDLAGARSALDADLSIKRELLVFDQSNAVWRTTYLYSLLSRAAVLANSGEADSALAHLDELDGLLLEMRRTDPVNRDWRRSQAVGQARRAEVLVARGAVALARPLVDSAIAAMQELVAADTRAADRNDLAMCRIVEGQLHLREGNAQAAQVSARAAMELLGDTSASATARGMVRNRLLAGLLEARALQQLGPPDLARARWNAVAEEAAPLLAAGEEPPVLAAAVEARLALGDRPEAGRLLPRLRATGYREAGFVQRLRELGVTY
jgi:eukaryotic-like serine/threonine-protein kinase